MKNLRYFLFISFMNISCWVFPQGLNESEQICETEKILNVVLNSQLFDSLHPAKRVQILTNELLTINSFYNINRKKRKARILTKDKLKVGMSYIVLADFTIDWEVPTSVRVQFELMPEEILLNYRLIKIDGIWQMQYSVGLSEDFDTD